MEIKNRWPLDSPYTTFDNSSRIQRRFPTQINTNKAAYCLAVVYSIFRAFIRKTKALLHNAHAQFSFKTNWWMTSFASNRIVRDDDIQ